MLTDFSHGYYLKCRVAEEPFYYLCLLCLHSYSTSCQGNKTRGNKGRTLRLINTVFSKPLAYLNIGPACVTTVAVNSSFVSCWERWNSCWDTHSTCPSDILAPWMIRTYPDDGSDTCLRGKEPDTGATACKEHCFTWQSKQAACAGMVVAAYSQAETDLDTLPPSKWVMQWAGGWAQGYLWDKAFCSGRFWFGLFFSVLQNNRQKRMFICSCIWCTGPLFLYLMQLTKFLVVSLHQRKANCQESM